MTKNSAVPAKAGGLLPYLRKEERKGGENRPFLMRKTAAGVRCPVRLRLMGQEGNNAGFSCGIPDAQGRGGILRKYVGSRKGIPGIEEL